MQLPQMKSVKLTPAELKQEKAELTAEYTPPAYPWGTRLCLDEETIKKIDLNVGALKAGETKMVLVAMVEVVGVRSEDRQENDGRQYTNRSVDLQITSMALETPEKAANAADVLYKD